MWTPEAIETARRLKAKGYSMRQIAMYLSDTYNHRFTQGAVIGKLWREARKALHVKHR